jgi:hypothetical protein
VDGTNRVFASALRSPKGNVTWLIVNDAPRAWSATLEARGGMPKALHQYQSTAEQRDQAGVRLRPLRTIEWSKTGGRFADTLPAMSLTVYSSYDLGPSARGVVAE